MTHFGQEIVAVDAILDNRSHRALATRRFLRSCPTVGLVHGDRRHDVIPEIRRWIDTIEIRWFDLGQYATDPVHDGGVDVCSVFALHGSSLGPPDDSDITAAAGPIDTVTRGSPPVLIQGAVQAFAPC